MASDHEPGALHAASGYGGDPGEEADGATHDAAATPESEPGGPQDEGAEAAPAPSYDEFEDVPRLKRQLAATRAEVRALLDQLSEFNAVRAEAMERGQQVEALRASVVSLESERDQYRDLAADRRRHEAALEERLRQAREDLERARARTADKQLERLKGEVEEARRAEEVARKAAVEVRRERDDLERRLDDLTEQMSDLTADRDAASQRAERTRVALERLRKAFVRTREGEQGGPDEEAAEELREALAGAREEVDSLRDEVVALRAQRDEEVARREALEAQVPEPGDALSAALGTQPGVVGERMVEAEKYEALKRHAAQLERRAEELERAVESAVASALEAEKSRRQTQDLEQRAEELERALEEERSGARQRPGEEGGRIEELKEQVDRLRSLVQNGSSQIQRYLLELEGSKGAIARSRQEIRRYADRVDGLHEGIGHLRRYLHDAGPEGDHALVLLQEIKRCADEIRGLVESNDRFSRSMDRTMERLAAILKEPEGS